MAQKILIIGLGIMGAPMARNIIQSGFDVSVCDAQQDVLDDFEGWPMLNQQNPASGMPTQCDYHYSAK